MQIVFLALLFVLGACFGSFLCCQARRLNYKTTHKKALGNRSVCMSCKKQLKWYDNLPIISWLVLRGKCRKCGKKIGNAEIFSELGLAAVFFVLGTTINVTSHDPLTWAIFIVTIIFSAVLFFLAIYDGLYGELPTLYLVISIVIATIIAFLKAWTIFSISFSITDLFIYLGYILLAILIFGGLYLVLYLISKGKWVGDGDWLLATAIALALSHPWFSLVALFLTNFLAVIYALPHLKKNQKIHLGPFMVVAYIITTVFTNFLEYMI